jgi:hypothetical protein
MNGSVQPSLLPPGFQPALAVDDALASYWLAQVTLRLRREICWLWRERGQLAGARDAAALLPPFTDRLGEVLDLQRYGEQKRAFFESDATAAYLGQRIAAAPPAGRGSPEPERGSFTWLARELALSPVECFVLAMALSPVVDCAAGTVLAACANDPQRTAPTLALAQRLWDAPAELLPLLGPGHALGRHGLLTPTSLDWDTPLAVPPVVARRLVLRAATRETRPRSVRAGRRLGTLPADSEMIVAALRSAPPDRARVVPICGARESPLAEAAEALAAAAGQRLLRVPAGTRAGDVPALATLAWLEGAGLYVDGSLLGTERVEPVAFPLPGLPVTVFVGLEDRADAKRLRADHVLPLVTLAPLSYHERLAAWQTELPEVQHDPALAAAAADCARRFRIEHEGIARAARSLRALGRPLQAEDLSVACRADIDLGELARPVVPRFGLDELMLPARQSRQVREFIAAVRSLTAVHYEWGTARAWNESGLSALFSGPPGTGKTMAAEAIAQAVGMPLFRIDLSQVVNKYIGETEKNLARLFDAADAAEIVLFFDEADALFGRRTEVKDAHDRYANLEISYLLERMERFKGVAILATNRKKDLDEAFLRRLRCVVDFPLPGPEERLRIWSSVIPAGVDASALDLSFLAQRFSLAGGHIRAVVFHACLQSAACGAARTLDMPVVIRAVRGELEKLGRPISLEQFAPYARYLEE